MNLERITKIDREKIEQYCKEEVFLRILYVVVAGIIVAQTMEIDILISLLFHSMVLLTGAAWLCTLRKGINKHDYLILGIIVLAGINIVLNCFWMGGTLGFSYIKKYILFCTALLFFQTVNKTRISYMDIHFIYSLTDILTVWFIVMYILQGQNRYLINGIVSNYLTFRFDNPNLISMFLLCLFMIQMSKLFTDKEKERRIHIVFALCLAFFIFKTASRNCELVMAAYLVVYGWLWLTKKKQFYIPKFIAVGISVFPAIFFGLYMLLINSVFVQNVFGFMVGVGKDLDSRMKIWGPGWNGLKESPVIGAYYQISNGTGTGQMHNTHLDIAAAYGVVVLVLVCVYLFLMLYQNGRRYRRKQTFCFMIGWAAVILLGMGEAAMYNGGLGIYLFMGTFLLLANSTGDIDEII